MQTAITIRTTVQSGGRIEVVAPDLPAGQTVDVVIQLEQPAADKRPSVLDVLAACEGHRIFKSAAEVDAYLREERDSWDR